MTCEKRVEQFEPGQWEKMLQMTEQDPVCKAAWKLKMRRQVTIGTNISSVRKVRNCPVLAQDGALLSDCCLSGGHLLDLRHQFIFYMVCYQAALPGIQFIFLFVLQFRKSRFNIFSVAINSPGEHICHG
jgi:hypothetical protein